MNFTGKQQRFIEEFLVHPNATKAAVKAGYSEKTARSIASENLKKPAIAAEIARRRGRARKRLEDKGQHIVAELAQIGFSSIGQVLTDDWQFIPFEEWSPEFLSAVQRIRFSPSKGPDGQSKRVTGVKMQNKNKALATLLKTLGPL